MTVYQRVLRAAAEDSLSRMQGCTDPIERAYYKGRAEGFADAEAVGVRLARPSVRMKVAE